MCSAFTFFCTIRFVNVSTIGYHLKANNLMTDENITLLYSFAMIVDAFTALKVGKMYDKLKLKTKSRPKNCYSVCTGVIIVASSDTLETLKGYYNILYRILANHGISYVFYTDRRILSLSINKRSFSRLRKKYLHSLDMLASINDNDYACDEV
ncbi:MAG: Major facilitator superfamily MFS_1 [Clostridiales bacterium 38_11]|nr:MAG: Major facilitator superfamily MFS_1 [Clostridiales bacterium 38_11]